MPEQSGNAPSPRAILVTGGAGFIGSHLVDRLVADGHEVRVLDTLEPQVHGDSKGHRNAGASYVEGSVLDRDLVAPALEGVDAVVHLAAQVGVGQSMYDMARYVQENCTGTAVLLEEMARRRDEISSLVVASSMSIYGEGQYACDGCGRDEVGVSRVADDLAAGAWEPRCAECGAPAHAVPTPETKRLESSSIYATTKRDQEDLALVFGRAYSVRTVALRFFNVYGPRQSLSNPYTGVAAIFAGRLLNGRPPLVFEDGLQSRDFVHVSDIVEAIVRSMTSDDVGDVAMNVGTGASTSVLEVARTLSASLGLDIQPEINGRFRQGDIRHCIADIERARTLLGYEPRVTFADGMAELVRWIEQDQPKAEDLVQTSTVELEDRGLIV
ncbi:MAG: dTDP-L-rhamnose 4-epimerase [Solirubrobacteraceae bacterium]|jgi:dTDP-L-rhamnose 4-epimerase|nr:dTDP-L-rhamnose 4-epimerase [Solirubrobacteraceae bacterium]